MSSCHQSFSGDIEGVGIGLRHQHCSSVLANEPDVPWFELLADNWLAAGGLDQKYLQSLALRYPMTLHGVGLNLGGTDPLDFSYLDRLKALIATYQFQWYSEHLCFSAAGGLVSHDLLPLPFTEEAINHVANRIEAVQDRLGSRILLENVSAYMRFPEDECDEVDFFFQIAAQADCYLLLDLNNLYVNETNHAEALFDKLLARDCSRIKEIHLAGHSQQDDILLDTHSSPISPEVWAYYQRFIQRHGTIPTLIEWDHSLPPWQTLMDEKRKAEAAICLSS